MNRTFTVACTLVFEASCQPFSGIFQGYPTGRYGVARERDARTEGFTG
ncbi:MULTISPECIES: hypothetical protein [unclassified Microcoleus]|nr:MULTISPECIES: hypothetical protein [unclassified Microcoleus]MCC3443886.1 hypothetical protein [Microcoleus sp. PH2017_03_ELD_O_A]MCC3498900.1 hypothetical protein [Microcoleus sp. PH2017_15_JOR_U_A]MCC3523847.1 hypothetical protein [Microcoleus sp. PH2017_20_SFW_D_A]MCC3554321.1 hypothetical protein [Microcoleus sp. PH2017_35_SFW_U_B]